MSGGYQLDPAELEELKKTLRSASDELGMKDFTAKATLDGALTIQDVTQPGASPRPAAEPGTSPAGCRWSPRLAVRSESGRLRRVGQRTRRGCIPSGGPVAAPTWRCWCCSRRHLSQGCWPSASAPRLRPRWWSWRTAGRGCARRAGRVAGACQRCGDRRGGPGGAPAGARSVLVVAGGAPGGPLAADGAAGGGPRCRSGLVYTAARGTARRRDAGSALDVEDVARIDLDELRAAWEGTLPALFGADCTR